jgi:hypothetical protein
VTPPPLAAEAAGLAAAVAWLGEDGWGSDAARIAGADAPAPRRDGPPTFGEVARRGTAVVEALSREGRFDEAAAQARHLKAFFAREGRHLGPIAVPAFDGLLAATIAGDPYEIADFIALIREIFP